jgi:hypothetical protein
MPRLARILAAVAGLALPVGLALAVYAASAGSLSEPIEGTRLPSETIARPSAAATTTDRAPRTQRQDESGPCDEAEHADDPRCTGAATDDDGSGDSSNSGPGSSADSDGDGDSRGRGRGRSGSGSDSDSSGSGSGDD